MTRISKLLCGPYGGNLQLGNAAIGALRAELVLLAVQATRRTSSTARGPATTEQAEI